MNNNRKLNKKRKEIELAARGADSYLRRHEIVSIKKKRIRIWRVIFVVAFLLGAIAGTIWLVSQKKQANSRANEGSYSYNYIPVPEIELMKRYGCVADGLLSGYGGDTENSIALLERSQCRYLHRAVETWAAPPDFEKVSENINKFKRKDFVFSMFLAEAINPGADYYYSDEGRNFNFSKMCKEGTEGTWGPKTCKADFGSEEYRKYLRYITQKAIDLDIKSFLFGQIYFQEKGGNSLAPGIVKEMRNYAAAKGKKIIIGAQTNTISDPAYLKLFDYIEGGVGVDEQGNLEKNPCYSKFSSEGGWCWALLWNQEYARAANNIILHLDWSGQSWDDMSVFARMNSETREKTLEKLYNFFSSPNTGFLMPFLAVVDRENNGCYGPEKGFYSPDNKYSCRDENAIDSIFRKGRSAEEKNNKNKAEFVSQNVPKQMESGKEYKVEIILKNSGTEPWSGDMGYRLGSQNPQDNDFFGGRVSLEPKESIASGEKKKFSFKVRAPKEAGKYNFQWRMLQEKVAWFGELTPNKEIEVIGKAP